MPVTAFMYDIDYLCQQITKPSRPYRDSVKGSILWYTLFSLIHLTKQTIQRHQKEEKQTNCYSHLPLIAVKHIKQVTSRFLLNVYKSGILE